MVSVEVKVMGAVLEEASMRFSYPQTSRSCKEYDAANHRKAPSRILARLIEVKYGNVIAAPPVLRY